MSNQVVSFHVWDHTKDRRTPDLRARHFTITEQVAATHAEFELRERVRKNIAARAVQSAKRLTENVVQFVRRA